MNLRFIGGILLIIGTTIGGGMLALPIATAQSGFIGAFLLLISSWLAMTLGAFLILEANLWLATDSNLISMSRATLGRAGEMISWIVYLLLLYSLLAAYIAGGSDVLNGLLSIVGIHLPSWLSAILFLMIFGVIVYLGIESIDIVNRGLMALKLTTLLLLIVFILPHVNYQYLNHFQSQYLISAVTVVFTSFGFATIIPSLRSYFNSDVKKLRSAIIIGSFIPLACYLLWVAVILGELPLAGKNGLVTMLQSDHATTLLTQALIFSLHSPWITMVVSTFTSICVATAFLGVALCLSDFIADGFKLKKQGRQKFAIFGLTFIPPLTIVFFYPAAFIKALSYAGILCAVLLLLLPAIMVWVGRYRLGMVSEYRVIGGKPMLIFAMLVSGIIIIQELLINLHLI